MIRRWKRVLRCAVFALGLGVMASVLGIGDATWRHDQVVILPPPTGPLAVGRTSLDWTDEARVDPLNPDEISKRELEVWAWYPADAPGDAPAAPYVPQPWASVLDQEHGVGAVLFQSNESVRAHAVPEAAVSAAQVLYGELVDVAVVGGAVGPPSDEPGWLRQPPAGVQVRVVDLAYQRPRYATPWWDSVVLPARADRMFVRACMA
jgi:hypothetical protein